MIRSVRVGRARCGNITILFLCIHFIACVVSRALARTDRFIFNFHLSHISYCLSNYPLRTFNARNYWLFAKNSFVCASNRNKLHTLKLQRFDDVDGNEGDHSISICVHFSHHVNHNSNSKIIIAGFRMLPTTSHGVNRSYCTRDGISIAKHICVTDWKSESFQSMWEWDDWTILIRCNQIITCYHRIIAIKCWCKVICDRDSCCRLSTRNLFNFQRFSNSTFFDFQRLID